MTEKIGREVAEEIIGNIYLELGLVHIMYKIGDDFDDFKSTHDKLLNSIMLGQLEYADSVFKLTLLSPITVGEKEITALEIKEPSGSDLREMASVKNKNDDVGKAMAVLGSVTGLGLPVINKLKSRDMMVSVSVISLFL
jgi:hypothetical protein